MVGVQAGRDRRLIRCGCRKESEIKRNKAKRSETSRESRCHNPGPGIKLAKASKRQAFSTPAACRAFELCGDGRGRNLVRRRTSLAGGATEKPRSFWASPTAIATR